MTTNRPTGFRVTINGKKYELRKRGPWLVVTGGGRRNPAIMEALAERLSCTVADVESVGWRGDALEAEAFAFVAARCLKGLPISFPGTTGAPAPMTGGRIARPG